METAMEAAQIKEMVRARYGGIAEAAGNASCCAPASSCCGGTAPGTPADKSRQMGYSDAELANSARRCQSWSWLRQPAGKSQP